MENKFNQVKREKSKLKRALKDLKRLLAAKEKKRNKLRKRLSISERTTKESMLKVEEKCKKVIRNGLGHFNNREGATIYVI